MFTQIFGNLSSAKDISDKIVFDGTPPVGRVHFQLGQITYNGAAYDGVGFTISNTYENFQGALWITWEGGCYYQVMVNGIVRPLVKLG